MAKQPNIKILYSPEKTYPGTSQGNYVGAQSTAGRRGTLPTFSDGNSYYISKSGLDANAGTSAAPKLTLASLFSTSQSYNDTSGNGYHLTQTGTVPYITAPCYAMPPQGNYAAGPFSDSNYLNAPAGLYGALTGATQFCVEGWVFFNSLSNAPYIWYAVDSSSFSGRANADGSLTFNIAGTEASSSAGAVVTGQWYYIAFSFQSATASAKKIWLGTSPTNLQAVSTATQTRTAGTLTSFTFGKIPGTANRYLDGYLDRMVVSSVQRTSFPVDPAASNILGFYEMETRPLMQTAPKSYIVIKDSGTYNEGLYANFQYDITAGFGIYAADGYTPTFKKVRGAVPGTFGAGNSSRAQLTSSSGTTCYVSKAGNDGTGTRGNSSLPFLTVQAAMSATTTSGDTVQIQDNGTYVEDLTLPSRNIYVQAATSKIPKLVPAGNNASNTHIVCPSAGTYTFTMSGIVLEGNGYSGYLYGTTNSAITSELALYDCTAKGYSSTETTAGTKLSVYNCYIVDIPANSTKLWNNGTNTYFKLNNSTDTIYLGGGTAGNTFTSCTFEASALTLTANVNATSVSISKCVFNGATVTATYGGTATYVSFVVSECDFNDAYLSISCGNSVGKVYVGKCIFDAPGLTYGLTLNESSSNQVNAWVYDCAAFGSQTGFYFLNNILVSRLYRSSTIGCTSHGVNSVSGVTAKGISDSGSASAVTGITPVNSALAATFVSTTAGAQNVTLAAGSAGIFGGELNFDAAPDYALFDIVMPNVALNGLTFEGPVNLDAGVTSSTNQTFTVAYCTFSGLGSYGVKVSDSSSVTYCLFSEMNGHAVKTIGSTTTISYCAGYSCAGAMVLNYGNAATLTHLSSYSCAVGQYDASGVAVLSSDSNIFSASGTYDYSGESTLTYCCVGTLDPDRIGTLDANSIRLDPLFRDPLNGDLRLMALEASSLFNSPCKSVGSSSTDMGAFAYTYGDCELSWIEIDFGNTEPSTGKRYRNPDNVERNLVAVKLTENDRENGAYDSSAPVYKLEYDMTWNDTNDMPTSQRIELEDLFRNASNVVRCSVDGGSWFDGYLVRRAGFVYSEASIAGYVSGVPTALRELIIREA